MTAKDLAGKTALVTGGGTGLGKGIAMELARRGATVVIASRKLEHLEGAANEILEATGATVFAMPTDVRDSARVEKLIGDIVTQCGSIDILVNNAAGNFVVPSEELTPNGWNAVIGIVLNGTWYCSSFAGKQMIKQGGGTILNIIATFAWTGAPGVVHSASAKAGVLAMTRTLAAEWGKYNIRVNALAPGVLLTEGASKNLLFDTAEAQKKILGKIPLKRFATVEEVAKLSVLLCSDDSSYITGDVMTVDGGRWLNNSEGFLDLLKNG